MDTAPIALATAASSEQAAPAQVEQRRDRMDLLGAFVLWLASIALFAGHPGAAFWIAAMGAVILRIGFLLFPVPRKAPLRSR